MKQSLFETQPKDHVAIMNPQWNLIPKILSGEKTIESRWYQKKIAPWDKINAGDTVYFKNSGGPVIAKAEVAGVKQFTPLDSLQIKNIIEKYGKEICLQDRDYKKWGEKKKYCLLIFLEKPQSIDEPFKIDKTGFGSANAWLVMENIGDHKMK